MLASPTDAPLEDPQLVYEPKYDGIRAIAEVGGGGSVAHAGTRRLVRLWSRLGNEKTHQFPEIARALEKWASRLTQPVVLDGEIVALDGHGEPTGFQQLQGRIHLSEGRGRTLGSAGGEGGGRAPSDGRTAFIAFDLLRDGPRDLRDQPFLERRAALERLFGRTGSPRLRISDMVRGDGRALYKVALDRGWEGLIAKQANSKYESGKRTRHWHKLKIVREQEFVIAGWTEPRQSRAHFGALLLGVHETGSGATPGRLVYVGHTGTGFNERELARVMKLLKPLETKECPFPRRPPTNERPHWVRPDLVAQIKFTEWTTDGKLRHPVYLGLRDDQNAAQVVREPERRLHKTTHMRLTPTSAAGGANPASNPKAAAVSKGRGRKARVDLDSGVNGNLIDQLRAIEGSRRNGILVLPGGDRLNVTNLHKVLWPRQKLTKGDLLRYYVHVSRYILPAVADRPLVMKRYPNGITGQPFYQHRALDAPPGVRVEGVTRGAATSEASRPQIVGGTLTTLLYMTQLAAISQDPWFSRVSSLEFADYVALDLDPPAGMKFGRVLDVARWIRDELDALGATGAPKTSGADGLHVYIPLPPATPYEAGLLLCRIVATVVAQKHPKAATVERSVKARGDRVYVDYLQNVLGKTLATAYSARASTYAGASAPLTWQEVDAGVKREEFTVETMPARIQKVGDLWATVRRSKGVDFSRVTRRARGVFR